MATENVTTKFRVDISDLKKNIAEANRQIKQYNAEIKNASAGMAKGEETADSLSKKIEAQSRIIEAEQGKLAALREQLQRYNAQVAEGERVIQDLTQKHEQAAREYGANSEQVKELAKQLANAQAAQERNKTAVQTLTTQITNQDTTLKNAQARLNGYNNALDEMQREERESGNESETLTQKVKRQENEIEALKEKYINAAAAHGKDSDEARQLATQIDNLSGELKENRTKLTEAEKAANEYDHSLEDLGNEADNTTEGGLAAFGVALGNLAANVISAAISKMKQLVAQTVQTGAAFDTAMSEVKAISGATGSQMDSLRQKAKDLGSSTKFTAVQTADAFKYMSMAGWKTEDMINGIGGVLSLAAASGADLGETSDIVTDALTAMGYAAGDAGRLADVMAAASSNANTNVQLMGSTFQYAAPIIGTLGYSMEDAAVAIGLMANAGIKGDKAGTALRATLTRLSTQPKECAMEMDRLGLSLTDSDGKMKSLDQVMQDLRVAFDGMGAAEKTATAKHIAGANAMSGFLAIVNASEADFNKLTEAIKNSEGAAADMAAEMMNNLGGDLITMSSNLEGLQLMLYEKFEPALRKAVSALDTLIDAFKWLLKNGAPIAATITGVTTAVATFMLILKKEAIITAFLAALTKIKTGFLGLNAVMMANPIALVVAAIAGLVAAFIYLWNTSDDFRNFWIGLWEKVKEITINVATKIKDFFVGIVDFFKNNWQSILLFMVNPFWGLFKFAYDNFEGFRNFIDGIIDKIKDIFSTIADWVNEHVFKPIVEFFKPVIKFFTTAWKIITELAKGTWILIKAVWGVVSAWFNEKVVTPVKNFFISLWDGIKTAAATAWNGIKTVWGIVSGWFNSTIIQPVKNFFSGMWNALKDGAAKAWNGIKAVFSPVASWFKDKFSEAWQKVKDVFSTGGSVFNGIKEGIEAAFKTVVNAIIRGINRIISKPFNAINGMLEFLRGVEIAGIRPFEGLLTRFDVPQIPELEHGGFLKKGQIGLLEGKGDEAVIPMSRNKEGLRRLAGMIAQNIGAITTSAGGSGTVINFNQTNNSPKPLSRWELYRQTKNLLAAAQGV